jgi:hypothetical protein
MNPPADLPDFVQNHRPHGSMSCDATTPASNGICSLWRVRVAA